MNQFVQKFSTFSDEASKRFKELKIHAWDNKTNRLTILFVIAAILVAAFTYNQYARRNFAFSASSQRQHNKQLREKLSNMQALSHQMGILSKCDGKSQIDHGFQSNLGQSRSKIIRHLGSLVANCSQQFESEAAKEIQLEAFFNKKKAEIDELADKNQ